MKILYVSMDNTPYGSRSHEVKVAEEFARQGHDVHLVVERQPQWTPESPKPDGIRSVSIYPVNEADKAIQIAAQLPNCDVGFSSSVSGANILAAWKSRTKSPVACQVLDIPLWRLIWHERAPWYRQWEPWHRALYEMNHLIVNTQVTKDDLDYAKKLYNETRPTPATSVVYYGIDVEEADKATADSRDKDSYPMAVHVSRLVPYKGIELSLAALALVGERIAYYVVGDGEDLMRLVQMDQLFGGGANFTRGISDASKFKVIKTADFGLFLAYNPHIPAQFPMESVYCGKPCIVADIPVNRERFLNHGVVYVNHLDSREVANAIKAIAKTKMTPEEALRERQWILENRSFRSHAKGILDTLETL